MYPHKITSGFTMLELLVVMVIIALLGGVVVPNIGKWIGSFQLAEQRKSFTREVSSLPAKAFYSRKKITIDKRNKLSSTFEGNIVVESPIEVMPNGFCRGGVLTLKQADSNYKVIVNPPLCSVTIKPI